MADARSLSSALADLPSKSDLGQSTLKKIAWRLLPLFALGYGVAIMDRNNIGLAALQMNRDLHFSSSIYGFGAGLFSIGYALCEIPSNLALYRFGARRWIARIMLTWGLLAMGMMFVKTPAQFYAMRFMLGIAEAGFFPGIMFYLLQWFPDNLRSRAISRFYGASPLVAIANGLLAGPLMSLQGRLGLRGWQWLFLLEGFPAVLLSVVFLLQLPNTPDEARWLSSSERAWLKARLAADIRTDTHLEDTWGSLRDKRIWLLGLLSFCVLTCIFAYALTAPTILQRATGFSIASIGVLTAINGVLSVLSITINATHSDRTRERRWHIVLPLLITAAAFLVSGSTKNSWWLVSALAVAITGLNATQGIIYAIPGSFLKGKSAAAGIAVVTTMGILGGFAGPAWIGWMRDATGSFQIGLISLAIPCLAGAAITASLKNPTLARSDRLGPPPADVPSLARSDGFPQKDQA
jgi:MFS transporter, ACS family, tartrate transporter